MTTLKFISFERYVPFQISVLILDVTRHFRYVLSTSLVPHIFLGLALSRWEFCCVNGLLLQHSESMAECMRAEDLFLYFQQPVMVTGSLKGAPLRYKLKMHLPLQVNGQQPSSPHHLYVDVTTSICLCCLSPSNHRIWGKHVGRLEERLKACTKDELLSHPNWSQY